MFLQAAYFSLSSAEDGPPALCMQTCTLPVSYSLRSAFLFLALGVGINFVCTHWYFYKSVDNLWYLLNFSMLYYC